MAIRNKLAAGCPERRYAASLAERDASNSSTSIPETLVPVLLDLIPTGIAVWQADEPGDAATLRLLFANRAASDLLGTDLRRRAGERIFELFPTSDTARVAAYAEVAQSGRPREFGLVKSAFGGRPMVIRAFPIEPRAVAVIFEDATARKEAESEAQQLNRFLDSIIEHIPAMVFMKDAANLRFERFNRAGEELLGLDREALVGKSDYDFFPADQAEFFVRKDREVLATGVVDIPEEPIQTKGGQRWLHTRKIPLLDENGAPRHLLGVSVDITETKQAKDELERRVEERSAQLALQIEERLRAERALANTEEQLRQAQKMEAVGRLAGGVAHDFNNILSAILSYSSLALTELGEGHPVRPELVEVVAAAERAGQLTRQLLAFSRRQMLEPSVVDLNEVITRLHLMLRRLIGEDIELDTLPGNGLHAIRVDVGQIEQVVLNLAVNARDAMPRGGRLRIETANVELAEGPAALLELSAGAYVALMVQDTGSGMDQATQARAFEPFFTTKEPGKGTGLGLSTVFGIVKQSGGGIEVQSQLGHGTIFTLYLPSIGEQPATRSEALARPPQPAVGHTTVLVAEDNDAVRRVVLSILRRAGYSVLEAATPLEALRIAERADAPIDLLLTDVVMPSMSGPELAQRLRGMRRGLRVLCMSGYTDDAILNHDILGADLAFIQKPITPQTLLAKLREVLEAPTPR